MDTLILDVRFAARTLAKNPGFTFVAVLVMALGIGANAAMFSVVNAVLLRPLSYPQPDRIVTLSSLWKKSGGHGQVSAPDYRDWRDQSAAFAATACYARDTVAVIVGQAAEYEDVAMVSLEFFRVFRVEPAIGHEFSPEEQKAGSSGAAVVSAAFAASHFGGAAGALGQSVRMFGKSLNVVGVMPPGFRFPAQTDIWFPTNTIFADTESRSAHNYHVVARLKEGVTLAQAQSQMTAIGARLEQKYPDSNSGKSVAVTGLRDELVGNVRLMLWILLAAVAVVLLIACANLANMLLAKAVGRTREMAVRAAVGASRGRIVRQLITESVVLALLSGGLGVLFAIWASRALVALAPSDVPRLSDTSTDARVLAFTFAVSVAASILFGLAPALQTLRVDLNKSLQQGSARASSGAGADRLRTALVVAEIALSVMLLAGASLLLRSLAALHNVALGFHPEHVLMMEASVPASDLESARRGARFYETFLRDAQNLPGVSSAGAIRGVPWDTFSNGSYWINSLPKELNINAPQAVFEVVAPETFATLRIPILAGRDFNASDTYDAPFSAIINQKLANEAFPGQDPLGHEIYCGLDSGWNKPMRIVGVVGDTRADGPAKPPTPEIFMPYLQHPEPAASMHVLVRTPLAPAALIEPMRQAAHALSPDVPVKFTTLEASLSETADAPRFRAVLLGLFAALAVCLAMAGVYAVMSYVVGQRSGEIGVRMALGASPRDILRLILRHALTVTLIGVIVGLACALAAARLLASMLFGVKPTDPLTYTAVSAALFTVALLASYIPARRAMRADPIAALRYE